MPARENLTPREAADYLRKSQRTLIRWRNLGIGPGYVKVCGNIIYRRADLDRYLDAHLVEPVREAG